MVGELVGLAHVSSGELPQQVGGRCQIAGVEGYVLQDRGEFMAHVLVAPGVPRRGLRFGCSRVPG